MLLRRLGNKKKIAHKIIQHFPPHKIYFEPFFGAAGLFFNKQKVQYNYLNDLDDDVVNLYDVILSKPEELKYLIEITPYHATIFKRFTKNKESDPVRKALRFLYLSNFSYLGKNDTLVFRTSKNKNQLLINYDKTIQFLKDTNLHFLNVDFRKFFDSIGIRNENERNNIFVYADPPYLNTEDNYSNSFTEQDTIDLFEILISKKTKFAISEFDNEFVINLAKEKNLNINYIAERQTLKSRNTEILITNYEKNIQLF